MASFKAVASQAPVRVAYVQTAAAGTAPLAYVFVNPTGSGEYFEVVEVSYIYNVAGGASAAAILNKSTTGDPAASTAISGSMDLTAAARTPRKATVSATFNTRLVAPGESLSIATSGTLTALTGLVVLVTLKPNVVRKTH